MTLTIHFSNSQNHIILGIITFNDYQKVSSSWERPEKKETAHDQAFSLIFCFFCFVYLFYWEKSFSLDKHESYCLMSFFLLTIHQSTERKLGIMYILFVHITSWEKLYLKHSCPKKEKTSMLKKCNQVLTENKKLPGKGMTLKLLKIIKEEAVG